MTVFNLESVLDFGKFKGCVVKNIISSGHHKYIQWCFDTIEWFDLDKEARKVLTETHQANAVPRYQPRHRGFMLDEDTNYDDLDNWL